MDQSCEVALLRILPSEVWGAESGNDRLVVIVNGKNLPRSRQEREDVNKRRFLISSRYY